MRGVIWDVSGYTRQEDCRAGGGCTFINAIALVPIICTKHVAKEETNSGR